MGSDFRTFAVPIMGTFIVAIIYSIVALANPKLVPFSNHPKEVAAVIPTSTAGPPPTPATSPTRAAATPAPGNTLTLVGKDLKFDKSSLQAKAGTVVIAFDNQDNGVPHNVHVFKGNDATGESVGMTDVVAGPVKQTLTLDLVAGTYFYHCDVHPTTMTGTLTVTG
jgi:plastocyanin